MPILHDVVSGGPSFGDCVGPREKKLPPGCKAIRGNPGPVAIGEVKERGHGLVALGVEFFDEVLNGIKVLQSKFWNVRQLDAQIHGVVHLRNAVVLNVAGIVIVVPLADVLAQILENLSP